MSYGDTWPVMYSRCDVYLHPFNFSKNTLKLHSTWSMLVACLYVEPSSRRPSCLTLIEPLSKYIKQVSTIRLDKISDAPSIYILLSLYSEYFFPCNMKIAICTETPNLIWKVDSAFSHSSHSVLQLLSFLSSLFWICEIHIVLVILT